MVDGKFFCYVCEDEKREVKIKGETRIPVGTYKIELRDEGGMTKRYEAKFPGLHRGMLWLRHVPGFEWVYIHIGNTDDHTEGCLLVGYGANRTNGENTVSRSTDAYKDLYKIILSAIAAGELVEIAIWEM
jgi:hypothetical protein